MPANAHLVLVAPDNEKFAVADGKAITPSASPAHLVRKPNAEYRSREHLTASEVEKLIEAEKSTPGMTPIKMPLLSGGRGNGPLDQSSAPILKIFGPVFTAHC